MEPSNDALFLTILSERIERAGCRLTDVDFRTQSIEMEGPDEVIGNCTLEVAALIY